jgi:hypothetical protein
VRFFALFVLLLLLPSLSAAAQLGQHEGDPKSDADVMVEKMQQRQRKMLNKERQAKLKKDTDKLFQLATELKHRVDKTNESILSIEVIKKTEEIEDLAKNIRKKMKEAY